MTRPKTHCLLVTEYARCRISTIVATRFDRFAWLIGLLPWTCCVLRPATEKYLVPYLLYLGEIRHVQPATSRHKRANKELLEGPVARYATSRLPGDQVLENRRDRYGYCKSQARERRYGRVDMYINGAEMEIRTNQQRAGHGPMQECNGLSLPSTFHSPLYLPDLTTL
ncbi:hypothetical protein F5B22DRAFT_602176 [Xylaria bambusicola]|uniref:uncharacterized protein n=1 Tax=Xylaria bambusicola TaxID=326684 RepID=UPI00200778F6|nr:uncharacterized protein F5B22DRAFT_602176 [Xylaria bambusicola]KAI0517743.1 hypothetical protein F5B22DRAFT_602176 [Xylaria bambusicola]